MTPDMIFSLSGALAMTGWAALLASPFLPRLSQAVAGIAIPLLLAVAYSGIALAHWSGTEGGFETLASVARLFEDPWLLLAGWIHYLAFDLFVGAWVVRTARAERIPFLLVIPCLFLTFLFGPAGFLLFLGLRLLRSITPATTRVA